MSPQPDDLCQVVEMLNKDGLVLVRWIFAYDERMPVRHELVPIEGVRYITIRVADYATGESVLAAAR